jgi:hypothetical protein
MKPKRVDPVSRYIEIPAIAVLLAVKRNIPRVQQRMGACDVKRPNYVLVRFGIMMAEL